MAKSDRWQQFEWRQLATRGALRIQSLHLTSCHGAPPTASRPIPEWDGSSAPVWTSSGSVRQPARKTHGRRSVMSSLVALCDFCEQSLALVPDLPGDEFGQCRRCGTVFCLPRPDLRDVTAQYQAEAYYEGKLTEVELRGQIVHYRPLARLIRRRLGHGAHVLEVGCASGGLLGALAGEGLRARGIDVSKTAVERATTVLGLDATVGRIEDLAVDEPVDAVLAFHVVEHLVNPSTLLDRARESLRPGGLLLLEVPDYGARMREQMGRAWPYFLPGEHLQHFTLQALSVVLADRGFRVERSQLLGGLGVLQSSRQGEQVASARGTVPPAGLRGALYRSRTVFYRLPGARTTIRFLNDMIGYRVLHRNAYLRVWARRT